MSPEHALAVETYIVPCSDLTHIMDIPFLVYALLALLLITIWLIASPSRRPKLRTVAILVLGDIGRSPRMMYHAESFARAEFETYLIGYGGTCIIGVLKRYFT